jgi:multidrug efflux pump subunit AcrB
VTLIASLFLALTINCAIFYKVTKPLKTYTSDPEENQMLSSEDRELLAHDREGKTLLTAENYTAKDKLLDRMSDWYSGSLYHVVSTRRVRLAFVFLPLVLLIFTFVFLSPQIGFKLFPSGDNPYIEFSLTAKEGTTSESMEKYVESILPTLSSIPEIKNYALEVRDRGIDMSVILHKKVERDAKGQRNSFEVEQEITSGLAFLESLGLKVEGKVQA